MNHGNIHIPMSLRVSKRASEQMSAAERARESSSPKQANEQAMRANEQTDERVAQYLRLDSWLFRTTVTTVIRELFLDVLRFRRDQGQNERTFFFCFTK